MLVTLGRAASSPLGGGDAVDDLMACHGRILRFVDLSARLAGGGPAAEVAEAAAAVHRYFSVALPLHAEDEDASLVPRLLQVAPELRGAIEETLAEHRLIEELLGELVPLWADVAGAPARRLADGASRLAALFAPHLEREERLLFPAARERLSPGELAALRGEIRARRAAPVAR